MALWMWQVGDLMAQRLALIERTGAFDALRAERQAERDRRAAMGVDPAEVGSANEDDAAWDWMVDRSLAAAPPGFGLHAQPPAADALERVLQAHGVTIEDLRDIGRAVALEEYGPGALA